MGVKPWLEQEANRSAGRAMLLAMLAISKGEAEDRTMMNAGMATEMRNAFALEHRTLQMQMGFLSEDVGGVDRLYRVEPQLLWGVIPNGFLALGTSLAFDHWDAQDSGNLGLQGLYNLNQEGDWLPATALMVGTDFPTGTDANRWGVHAVAIVTKTIGDAELSLNVEIGRSAFRAPHDRDWLFRLGFGADYPLDLLPAITDGPTLLRTALVLEQQEEHGSKPFWQWQSGVYYPLPGDAAVAIGTEVNISVEQPDFGLSLSFQQTFSTW